MNYSLMCQMQNGDRVCTRGADFQVSDCIHTANACSEHLSAAVADSCPRCVRVTYLRGNMLPRTVEAEVSDMLHSLEQIYARLAILEKKVGSCSTSKPSVTP